MMLPKSHQQRRPPTSLPSLPDSTVQQGNQSLFPCRLALWLPEARSSSPRGWSNPPSGDGPPVRPEPLAGLPPALRPEPRDTLSSQSPSHRHFLCVVSPTSARTLVLSGSQNASYPCPSLELSLGCCPCLPCQPLGTSRRPPARPVAGIQPMPAQDGHPNETGKCHPV